MAIKAIPSAILQLLKLKKTIDNEEPSFLINGINIKSQMQKQKSKELPYHLYGTPIFPT